MKKRIVTIAVLVLLAVACNTVNDKANENKPSPEENEVINPNGTSELAQLMRDMFEAGKHAKQQLTDGDVPVVEVDYEKILTATPTNPGMIDYPEFKPMAKSYIQAMNNLKNAESRADAIDAHMAVVSTCKGCHTVSCPGPMMRIGKLELPKEIVSLSNEK